MKLSDDSLQELYNAFPLLRDVILSRDKIGPEQFYALSSLRPVVMNQKVQECLEWITSQVEFVPAEVIPLLDDSLPS
jgi:hypothetical protein